MLKSTYKPSGGLPPLPAGWTEHKAPTGHSYYYNAASKESTYSRPSAVLKSQTPSLIDNGGPGGHHRPFDGAFSGLAGADLMSTFQPGYPNWSSLNTFSGPGPFTDYQHGHRGRGDFRRGRVGQFQRRPPVQDRPKSKQTIPGCAPWLLVKTKLGRRFVYNPDKGESFWKFPPDVMKGVVELDRVARERKERIERGEDSEPEEETALAAEELAAAAATAREASTQPSLTGRGEREIAAGSDSDEYEEVEVTDDEDDEDEENPSKRRKIEDEQGEQPVEFNEDDIAYQLAAMGQEYGLDPGEYGDGQDEEWEEGAQGLPLTDEDTNALFRDMLDDHHISPYTTWDKVIEDGNIIEDDRYTVLSSMKARRDVWGEWSKERIQRLREQREKEEKKDSRIPYLSFLQKNATPKLYWPEFRRKYKKEAEMGDAKLSDKEREKWYRDYISRLKLPESTLKSDLSALLKSLPLHVLNKSTSLEALPPVILTDIRYVSLRPYTRDPLIEAYISTLPPAPEQSDVSPEEEAELSRQKQERGRRERALAERERRVQEEKRRQKSALQYSKGMLREGEEEIERAMKVSKEGLRGYLEGGEAPKLPNSSREAGSTPT